MIGFKKILFEMGTCVDFSSILDVAPLSRHGGTGCGAGHRANSLSAALDEPKFQNDCTLHTHFFQNL